MTALDDVLPSEVEDRLPSDGEDRLPSELAPDTGQSRLSSYAQAIPQGAVKGTGGTIQGVARGMARLEEAGAFRMHGDAPPEIVAQLGAELAREKNYLGTAEDRKRRATEFEARLSRNPLYIAGQALTEAADETYPTNPRYEGFTQSTLRSGGQMIPTLAAGAVAGPVAAGLQYGTSSGQQGAEEAIAAGKPEHADIAYLSYLGLGAASEVALGVPARLWKIVRGVRESGLAKETAKRIIAREFIKQGAYEAGQESLEQIGQNLVAGQTFDPNRPVLQDVPQSAAAGFLLGGTISGAAAGVGTLGRKAPPATPESQPTTPAPILDEFGGELDPRFQIGTDDLGNPIYASSPEVSKNVPATITGSNVRQGTEMPAETGGTPAPEQSLPQENDKARFARENTEAVAALRQQKELADAVEQVRQGILQKQTKETKPAEPAPSSLPELPSVPVTDQHLADARDILLAEAEAQRSPDLMDELESVTGGTILFPPDYTDALAGARERASLQQFQTPYAKLRKPQREQIDRQLRASTTEGTPADQVLTGLQRENPKYADWNVNDFADAVLAAGEGRATPKQPSPAAVKSLAQELAQAEVQSPESNVQSQEGVEVPFSLATASRVDKLAQEIHGKGYADLENWQQDAIRQAVERGTRTGPLPTPPELRQRYERPTAPAQPVAGGATRAVSSAPAQAQTSGQSPQLRKGKPPTYNLAGYGWTAEEEFLLQRLEAVTKRSQRNLSPALRDWYNEAVWRREKAKLAWLGGNPRAYALAERRAKARNHQSIATTQKHVAAANPGQAPVRVVHDARLVNGQMWEGTVTPDGTIVLNAAAPGMDNAATVAEKFRHELAHRELMSDEGQRQQERLVGKLTQTQRAELQALGYTNFLNLSPDAYERWLTNEFIARQAEQDTAWWQRYVQHVADWLRGRKGLAEITNEEVARAILRSIGKTSNIQHSTSNAQPYSLAQTDTRRLSRQIDAATWLTPEQKATLTNRIYNVANIPAAKAAAADLLQSLGLPAAQNLILDPTIPIPGAVRAQLMQAVARELARTSPAQYADFMNRVIAQTTDAGQYIAHLKGWSESTPDGAVATAVRILDGVTDKVLASYRDLLSAARQALSDGHTSAKADTLRAEPVQQAAAEAVDEAITKDKDVQAAIRTEAREGLVNDPEVRKAAASALPPGTDISDVLNVVLEHFRFDVGPMPSPGAGTPGAGTPREGTRPTTLKDKLIAAGVPANHAEAFARSLEAAWVRKVKAIEDSIPKHLRDLRLSRQVLALAQAIVNGLKPSADSARERLRSRFNPSPAPGAAMSLSKQPAPSVLDDLAEVGALMLAEQDYTLEQFNAALLAEFGEGIKAQLPQAYPKAKARLEAEAARHGQRRITRRAKSVAGQEIKATALNRLLRDKLKQWNLTLGEALKNPQNGRKLGDAIVTDAKLEGVQADRLRERINGLFDKLARDRKQKQLAKLERDVGQGKQARSIVQATRQAIALDNAGALDDAGYRELIRQALGLKSLTAQEAANLRALAQKIQAIPEGQEQAREEAAQKLAHAIGRLRPGHWWDFPMAFWYANILSGPTTHMVNALSNALNLAGTLAAKTVQNPASLQQILPQLARGVRQAVPEMVHALQTGSVTGPRLGQKFNDPGVWERVDARWTLPWKLVGRALAAGDLLFFYPAYQVEQGLMARNLAKAEGASGQRLTRRIAEILGNTEAVQTSAAVQATSEGYTGLKHRRRVEELLQQRRDDLGNFTEAGREFALRTTFNNTPYGLLGAAAGAINAVGAKFPAARLVVPFTNIIANVVNESINYTPMGSLRALATRYGGANLYGKNADLTSWADRNTLAELHAKAAVGTLLLGALLLKAASHADDDDPPFAITGQGPGDAAKRKTLLASGWMPNSIKLGNRYYSYLNTPAAVPLAIAGNMFDGWKYKGLDEAGALDRAAYGLAMSAKTLVQQSFLDSLARLVGAVEHPSATRGGDRLADWAGRTGSSFVVPNAVRQVNQVFDPDKFEAFTVQGELLRHIPFVRSNLKPTLNGLGEPVTRPWTERFTKPENPDPLWHELARLNVGVYPSRMEWRGEPLSDEQLYEVVRTSGPMIRRDLERIMDRPAYARWNDKVKQKAVSEIIEARHTQAKVREMRPER